jgi:pimeloyl-ACP methyl ester carboxylesterase
MWKRLVFLLVILIYFSSTSAQEGSTCPEIVQKAVNMANDACTNTGRNQVCYGNYHAQADPWESDSLLRFEQPGDIIPVVAMHGLRLSPLDESDSQWGIALMRIQANIPDTLPGQNVTFVLFGDVEIENAGNKTLPTINATAVSNANLRSGPSTTNAVVGSLTRGELVTLDGRSADSHWLRLQRPEGMAWVYGQLITLEGDVNTLEIIDLPDVGIFGPMQAFYLRSGIGDAPCAAAPESGLLIQTPRGIGEITLDMDGMEIALASTAFVNGGGDTLNVFLLQGRADFPQIALSLHPGQWQTFTRQNDAYISIGDPQDFDPQRFDYLPLSLLPHRIDIPQRGIADNIVYNDFAPSRLSTPDGRAALLLHGARLDKASWDWLISPLRDAGWYVVTPDMPGHGETAIFFREPNWTGWVNIAQAFIARLQAEQNITSGIIVGSSIGANVALNACAALPGWCLGVVLLSPGTNYYNVATLDTMRRMGEQPVFIATSENDTLGGPGRVARQIAAAGQNVTLHIYDGSEHGTDLASAHPLVSDIFAWLATVSLN